jgi:phosphoserine phosphatase RsbU/P
MGSSPSPRGELSAAPPLHEKGPHLRVLAVNIFVRDQERSLQFYRDQLGFDLAFDARLQSGERWVAVSPPDGSAVLTLISPPADSEEYKLIGRPTPVVFVTEDVAAKYHEWRKRGVRFRHTPRLRRVTYEGRTPALHSLPASSLSEAQAPVWGGVFTRFEDIDRNSFALVSLDEVTREVEARRRALAEKLESDRRVAQELEIAKRVQARLFPQTAPALRTLDYAGTCIPARQVGGDYYDFLSLGQDRLGLVIGDVSGKGIAAALLMANLQANLRGQCAIAADEPQRLLRSVNHLFCENTTDSAYATLIFAEYDDQARRLRYANCGHLTALLLRGDGTLERLASTATVLGLFADWECGTEERLLFSGDTLLLYTDGVTESFNQKGEEYGEHRLVEALRRHQDSSSHALLAAIVDEVRRFSPREQHDDITLIVAKCREAADEQMNLLPARA